MVDTLHMKDTHILALMAMQAIAGTRAKELVVFDAEIIEALKKKPEMSSTGATILTEMAKLDEVRW